ncbi:MAG: SUMF1/EgtB/PvdO family nonheme iron enzyme [Verrucomicrobiota bacterium]
MAAAPAAPPVVSNVTAAQRPGSEQVEIRYDLADPDSPVLGVTLQISKDSGTTWTVPVAPVTGALGAKVPRGTGLLMIWDAGRAWDNQRSEQMRFRITASDVISTAPPPGFSLIPAGSFLMGNQNVAPDDQALLAERSHRVTLDGFYMAKFELTKAEWDEVHAWALTHGYDFGPNNSSYQPVGKAPDHPVHSMTWWDAVKWCNAKTEKEGNGLQPCYTLGPDVWRKGTPVRRADQPPLYVHCDFTKNGYRLPTEAEWEKAARGGQSSWRFPWGNTISFELANYSTYSEPPGPGYPIYSYDEAPFVGYHPKYVGNGGITGNTAPVTDFPGSDNGYGLRQMAGNVAEWCWDLYDGLYYSTGPALNPRGPDPYSFYPVNTVGTRVHRGGLWNLSSRFARVAARYISPEDQAFPGAVGIRLARSL